ncbi:MAG: DUF6468 domain-containing protein [Pseudomonadota bacterium]
MSVTLIVELVVAILLATTIGYCIALSRKLQRLKTDEEAMREMVASLIQATGKAEYSIRALKATAEECEHTISDRLDAARGVISEIDGKRKLVQSELVELIEVLHALEGRRAEAKAQLPVMGVDPGDDPSLVSSALDRLRKRAA